MKDETLTVRINRVLVQYRGMSGASSVTQAFAYCIFGAHCTALVSCETDKELADAITDEIVSQAAFQIVSIAKPYFSGRIEMIAA